MKRIRNAGNSDLLASRINRLGEGRIVPVDNPSPDDKEGKGVVRCNNDFLALDESVEVMEEEKKREEEERKRREEMIALAGTTVNVDSVGDLKIANCYVGVIVIASNCCNDCELGMLDLSRFVNLRDLIVGDSCFEDVKEVKLIGLNQLESVMIGKNCFTREKNSDCPEHYLHRHFYLKNCERLRELKMGRYSFSDYSVCEIENVNQLQEIVIGELNEDSYNFYYASLELKSDSERMK